MTPINACPGSAAPLRLLLVEDDMANRAVFVYAAEKSAVTLRVDTVNNGAEALRYLEGADPFANREQYPLPDVLVLDLAMPLMNGFEVLQVLRTLPQWNALPIVVLSGVTYPGWKETALDLGAVKYLEKGARLEDWIKLVEEIAACAPPRQGLGTPPAAVQPNPEPPAGLPP